MFPEQIQRLRSGLHTLNILPNEYIRTNPFRMMPTFDPARSSSMNPFAADLELNKIVRYAEEKGLTTNDFNRIDEGVVTKDGFVDLSSTIKAKSVNQSGQGLDMFIEFHRFLEGAATKKYAKNLDNIPEEIAIEIEAMLRKQYTDLPGLRNHLRKVIDNAGGRFENEMVGTTVDLMKILNEVVGSKGDGNIGKIPNVIVVSDSILKLAQEGKLGNYIESFKGVENQSDLVRDIMKKANIMVNTTFELMRASKKEMDQAHIINDYAKLEAINRLINQREISINNELGLKPEASNAFKFENAWQLTHYLKNRVVNKKIAAFSKMLDRAGEDSKEVMQALMDSGLIVADGLNLNPKRISSVDNIKIVDENFVSIKDSKLVSENKLFLSSILEILGAKAQYDVTDVGASISMEQIRNLKGYLNSKGLNVDAESLSLFATESVRRIARQNFLESKLNEENIGVFQAMHSLGGVEELGNKFHLMKYDRAYKGRPLGIVVNKIAYEGSDPRMQDIVKEYNSYVDTMIKNGKVQGKNESFVKEGDTYTLTNEGTFLTIQSVLMDARLKGQGTARKELMDFLLADMGKNQAKDAALTFMSAYPEKTSKLVKLLINNGTIELKPGEGLHEGTFEYYINKEVFAKKEIQQKILQFIERYGINLDTLDIMTNRAQKDLEVYLEEVYGLGDHKAGISQDRFFSTYMPNRPNSPEKINEYLTDTLFDINNQFRGFEAVNDIITEMQIPRGQEGKAYNHLMQLITNKMGSTTKKVAYWADGDVKIKDTDLTSYHTPYFTMFDKLGIKYMLVDGMSQDWVLHPEFDKLLYQPLDIFQHNSEIVGKFDKQMINQRRELFLEMLHKKTDIEGFEGGLTFIEMPGLKMSLAVSRKNLPEIKQAFKELYDRQIINAPEGSVARRKLEFYKERMEQTIDMNDLATPEAVKMLIAESMFVGKNKNELIKYLEMNPGEAELNKMFVGRQKLFNTMKFKRINTELVKMQNESMLSEQLTFDQYQANEYYLKAKKFGIAVFDDSIAGFDLKQLWKDQNPGKSWKKYYGDRLTESGVDSISFISERAMTFLATHFGAPGSKVFKPVISSQGEHSLIYGKTEFVHDPKLESFFRANEGLDILMAASAEKLKLYQGRDVNNVAREMLVIPRNEFYNTRAIDPKLIIDVPLEAIGVQKIPDHYSPGKIAPSIIGNHTDINMSREIYNDYFADNIGLAMDRVQKVLKNPFLEYELHRRLKDQQGTGNLEDLQLLDSYGANESLQLEWLRSSPYASIDVFGASAKMSPLKARFLDAAMAPTSEYQVNGARYRFGGKSVIMQRMDTDLQGTLFNPETGTIERYGEMILPSEVGGEAIVFPKRNFKMKVINRKNNEVLDAEEVYNKFSEFRTVSYKDIAASARPLEALFNAFERGPLADYDLAISVMRFPRTRPNDLTLLRLRGFQKRSGNAAIVNPFDVYHIFEGDYDIDTVDYFWAGSNSWYRNIQRQQKNFVPTVDVSKVSEVLPDIELGSLNPEKVSLEWSKLQGNQRALSGVRGLVQGTSALVKHVDNIAEVRKGTDGKTRKVLMRNPNVKEGENGYWEVEMDWNNGDFHLRQAFEGQILLDATSPDPNILNSVRNWRYDFLFPKYSSGKTLAKEDFVREDGSYNTTGLRDFINGKKTVGSEYSNHRVRLFRRYEMVRENGELIRREVDLTEGNIDIIKDIMSQYSKLLEVSPGRKVYQQGTGKTAKYEDILAAGEKYFLHAKNFRSNIFYKMLNKTEYDTFADKTYSKYNQSVNSSLGNEFVEMWNPKSFSYVDKKTNQRKYDKKKKYLTTSPFPKQVEQNMRDRYDGATGGVVERSVWEIATKDPLNSAHTDTRVLTREAWIKQENLSNQLLHNDGMDVMEMNNFIPQLLGNINKDISTINSLKYQWVKLNKSNFKGKKKKLDELNKRIKEMEEKLKPLLSKKYWQSRKTKDIERFQLIDIQSDRNIIDGTAQYFTLAHLARAYPHNSNNFGYKADLKEIRRFLGENYAGQRDLWGWGDYNRKTIQTDSWKGKLSEVNNPKEIEAKFEEMLIKAVNKHGLSFLWDVAMPSAANVDGKIGVFNGNVMPVAINPSGSYKRIIKFLLKGQAGQLGNDAYGPTGYSRDFFRTVVQGIAEVDFTWRRYFNGQNNYLPLDAMETSKLITYGMPKWSYKLNNMFSKYTDVRSLKDVSEFNPFGMGRKYDMNIAFYRSLSNLDRSLRGETFAEGESILSYTNQIMMENGYMTPQKHLALMADVSQRLGPMMEKVFPNQVNIRTGEITPIKPFDMLNNPMYVLLGGSMMNGSGMSLDPWKAMNKYEQQSVNKMIRQVQEMKDSKRDVWHEAFFEIDNLQNIKKKPEDC